MTTEPHSEPLATAVETSPASTTHYAPAERARTRELSDWDPRSAPGTYLLLTVNVLVFLWMVLHGVSANSPNSADLQRFGANNAALVVNGQWYRLVTATFVHIGLFHIASNMWCLWNLGMLGEPLLGPWGLVAVYLLTGVAGNLLSIAVDVFWAHVYRVPLAVVSTMGAGASGAVFGIAGILIVLLSNRKLPIPWPELARLRKSVVQFAGINLVIGLVTRLPIRGISVHIDNAAHIGGFLSGLSLGPALVPRMTSGRVRYLARQKVVFLSAAFVLSLIGYWIANFR